MAKTKKKLQLNRQTIGTLSFRAATVVMKVTPVAAIALFAPECSFSGANSGLYCG
jgi:hypothetical protein